MGHALVHFIQRLFYGNTPLVDESRIPVTKQAYTLEIIPHLYDSSLFVMQIFLKMKFSTNSYKPSSLGYFIASRYEIRAWLASLLIDDFLAPATSALLSLLTALLRLRGRAPRTFETLRVLARHHGWNPLIRPNRIRRCVRTLPETLTSSPERRNPWPRLATAPPARAAVFSQGRITRWFEDPFQRRS